jgi:hypothetical protein
MLVLALGALLLACLIVWRVWTAYRTLSKPVAWEVFVKANLGLGKLVEPVVLGDCTGCELCSPDPCYYEDGDDTPILIPDEEYQGFLDDTWEPDYVLSDQPPVPVCEWCEKPLPDYIKRYCSIDCIFFNTWARPGCSIDRPCEDEGCGYCWKTGQFKIWDTEPFLKVDPELVKTAQDAELAFVTAMPINGHDYGRTPRQQRKGFDPVVQHNPHNGAGATETWNHNEKAQIRKAKRKARRSRNRSEVKQALKRYAS